MKNVLKLILGMVFVFGMTSMSDVNATAEKSNAVLIKKVPCSYVFDVCNTLFPDDYGLFDACMMANGC